MGRRATQPPRRAARRTARGPAVWLCLLAVAATLIAFLPALENDFTNWDDPVYVTSNYQIRDLTPASVRAMMTSPLAGNYHPLTVLSFALDYRLWGLDPRGYHATNVALHALNTAAVFWLVWLLTGSAAASAAASLFFGIHPLHVESVAWVSGRKDVLYTAFYLGSCIAYVLWARRGRKRPVLYAAAVVCFALSLLSKAMAVTLPLILVLLDWYLTRALRWKRLLAELTPFLLLAAAAGVAAIVLQRGEGAVQKLTLFPIHERLLYAFFGVLAYLFRAIAPVHLSALYPYPDKAAGALPAVFYLAPLAVLAIGAAVAWSLRRTRDVALGALFFLAQVAPVLQLIPVGNAIVADRYTYLAYVGLGIVLGSGARALLRARSAAVPVVAAAAIAASGMVLATRARAQVWKDSVTLWSDALAKYPNVSLAYNNRALGYMTRREYGPALADLEQALTIHPNYYEALINRANIAFLDGRLDAAAADLERAVALKPGEAGAWHGLGAVRFARGEHDRALEAFDRAIEIWPDYPEPHLNRANLMRIRGDLPRALADFDAFIRRERGNAQAYYWRGLTRAALGDRRGALEDYDAALRLDPKLGGAHLGRAEALHLSGRSAEALEEAARARDLGVGEAAGFIERVRSAPR